MTQAPWHPHEWKDREGLGPRWDDLRFPATAVNPPGQVSDPDIDPTDGTFLFDATGTELIFIVAQMPHAWQEGSEIRPHIHWSKTTAADGDVAWAFQYKMASFGEVMSDWSDVETAVITGGTDNDLAEQHLITSFNPIDMNGKTISTIVIMRIARLGGDATDTYAADARLLELDIHYIIDSRGSREEYRK